ncbi:hypothetical protein [Methanobrevibacter sp.]|nr:hypothetical protein [Methanobrevibacter sp.]MBR4447915.1 hypothetical protein [Methanobrevibacter sp.]
MCFNVYLFKHAYHVVDIEFYLLLILKIISKNFLDFRYDLYHNIGL